MQSTCESHRIGAFAMQANRIRVHGKIGAIDCSYDAFLDHPQHLRTSFRRIFN